MREYNKFVSRERLRLMSHSGCEPLTPDDIAEVVVFTAGRRENVVVADTLVFPNHQVCESYTSASLTIAGFLHTAAPIHFTGFTLWLYLSDVGC